MRGVSPLGALPLRPPSAAGRSVEGGFALLPPIAGSATASMSAATMASVGSQRGSVATSRTPSTSIPPCLPSPRFSSTKRTGTKRTPQRCRSRWGSRPAPPRPATALRSAERRWTCRGPRTGGSPQTGRCPDSDGRSPPTAWSARVPPTAARCGRTRPPGSIPRAEPRPAPPPPRTRLGRAASSPEGIPCRMGIGYIPTKEANAGSSAKGIPASPTASIASAMV